ncbi:MAG TPA: DUF4350 domain-containing protein [Anaerolineae bacterium]|nr:DUF4350 domain-containing protein [Anaerolineae bacterium]
MKTLRARISRDVMLLAALFLALAGFTAFVAIRQQQVEEAQQNFPPYSSHSANRVGVLALYEWLNRLGYHAERIENEAFQIRDGTRFLFILQPTENIERDEAQYILDWVQRGNTLILADQSFFITDGLMSALDVRTQSLESGSSQITVTQPLVDATLGELQSETFQALNLNRNDYVVYAAVQGKPVLARIPLGQGVVWVTSVGNLWTNENLNNENNAKVARALFANLPVGSTVAFDEYHHGAKPESELSLLNAIYNTPWGWGVIFVVIVAFGYLVINGQRFGRVVPVPRTLARRTPSEYVVSMANLFRRANKRGMVLNHYRQSLKRRLGRPFHLNPELSDERYIELLSRMRPELDRVELTRILNALRRTDTSEADLVKTIDQAVTFGTRR